MSSLPDYGAALSAFHRCAGDSLHAIVRSLPLTPGMRVLDAPCGDGTYLPWLRERVGEGGRVVGADRSAAFLELASKQNGAELVQVDLDHLPSPFDFVWCARSLYSLPDPAGALPSLRRVLVPGGRIGVLENDSFHHWLFLWPIELEVTVKRAQLVELAATTPNWTKAYVGRNLGALLREATGTNDSGSQDSERKIHALTARGLDAEIVTQFSFDADAVLRWLGELGERNIHVPVKIGVPGPISLTGHLHFAARSGVSASRSALQKYGTSIGKVVGTVGPLAFLQRLT
ncbi:MAG TPA: methyltransferase domain-containing protein, partial [Polyangiaceae bacterium]